MNLVLTPEESAGLEHIVRNCEPIYARRARLILLGTHGDSSRIIAEQVGLSAGRVRFWLRAFDERRMGVFPEAVRSKIAPTADVKSDERAGETGGGRPQARALEGVAPTKEQVSIEELCRRFYVDMAHAEQVARLAEDLFDMSGNIHGLSPEWRITLGKAGLLHNIGFTTDPDRHHSVGRDIILDHEIVDVSHVEQSILAFATSVHCRKIKSKRLAKATALTSLPADVQSASTAIAALIRIADGLDHSMTQSSLVAQSAMDEQGLQVSVSGPHAQEDSLMAEKKADLWRFHFDKEIEFLVEGEPLPTLTPSATPESLAIVPEKRKSPGILPGDAMSEAGRKVLDFHFNRMLLHEPGTRAGEDIEELHDMRVATRRMRSAFRLFGAYYEAERLKPFLRGLRATARALGRVRDLDVFMERAEKYRNDVPISEKNTLEPLLVSWREQREVARRQMLTYLDSKRYLKFVGDFYQFLNTPGEGVKPTPPDKPIPTLVYQIAPSLIYRRYEVVRGYERLIEDAPLEILHALRIDCKRFRYTLEFFREVLGPEVEDVIAQTVRVQDHLGALNDADVACQILIGFLNDWSELRRRERIDINGVTRYLVAKQNELRGLVDTFPEAWRQYNTPEFRRKLALAVASL